MTALSTKVDSLVPVTHPISFLNKSASTSARFALFPKTTFSLSTPALLRFYSSILLIPSPPHLFVSPLFGPRASDSSNWQPGQPRFRDALEGIALGTEGDVVGFEGRVCGVRVEGGGFSTGGGIFGGVLCLLFFFFLFFVIVHDDNLVFFLKIKAEL